jgi:hypothetical protein
MGTVKLLICTNIPLLQMFGAYGGSNLKDIGTGEKVSSCKLLSIDSLVVQKSIVVEFVVIHMAFCVSVCRMYTAEICPFSLCSL